MMCFVDVAHATIQEERCSPGNTCNVPISGSQSATLQPRITSYPESSSSLSRNPVTPKWTLMYDGNSVECMDSQCSRGLKVPKIGLHVNFTDGDDNQKNAIVSLETDMSISQTALLTFEIINADSPAIESCSQPTSLTSTVTYTLQCELCIYMNNLHFPICYAYSVIKLKAYKELRLVELWDEDTGVFSCSTGQTVASGNFTLQA